MFRAGIVFTKLLKISRLFTIPSRKVSSFPSGIVQDALSIDAAALRSVRFVRTSQVRKNRVISVGGEDAVSIRGRMSSPHCIVMVTTGL